jgi:hypothetical protein
VALVVIACVVLTGIFTGIAIKYSHLQSATDTLSQTLTVTGTPTLDIQDSAGQINIHQGTSNTQILVRATRTAHGTSQQEAQQNLSSVEVSVTPSGNSITIGTTMSKNGSILTGFATVDLDITTPAHSNVQATADAGTMQLDGVSGVFDLTVDLGDLEMRNVTCGDGSQLRVNAGEAHLSGGLEKGASLSATVNAGDLRLDLPADTSAHLHASTGAGSITISGWAITPTGSNSGMSANGDLGSNAQGTITLRDDTGDITVDQG